MKLKVMVSVLLLSVILVPAVTAQDSSVDCDPAVLSETIVATSKRLYDAAPGEVQQILDELESITTSWRESCVVPIEDYRGIPQSRTDDGGFVLGDPSAPVTIVEFADFLCPYCQSYKPVIDQFIVDFVATGQARFEYRFFPVVDPTYSPLAARFAECTDTLQPGAFWRAQDTLFTITSQGRFAPTMLRDFAVAMEMSYDDLAACAQTADQVDTDRALGNSLGIPGTPGVMVRYGDDTPQWIVMNGQTYDQGGPSYDVLQSVVRNSNRQS